MDHESERGVEVTAAGETLEQYADRIVAASRTIMLDRLPDDVIGCVGESHLIFGKLCAIEAVTTAMREMKAGIDEHRATTPTNGWRTDIENAPRNGTPIWVAFRSDIFPGLRPTRDDLKPWNGVQICVRHSGMFPGSDGRLFDPGWNVAAPVGQGGFPDDWIAAWMPLPPPPTTPTGERG